MKPLLFPTPLLIAVACACSTAQAENQVQLRPLFSDQSFERPVTLVHPPGRPDQSFLVEQPGRIRVLSEGTSSVFLDLTDRKLAAQPFEEGLLGLAFHPDYQTNRKLYLYYSRQGPKRSV
ncbi:MAG: PQQ-dependent sugar dehydrogenase, partial [Verrucomicrobiota bacterium]